MDSFIITGAMTRPNASKLGEGKLYEKARLVRYHTEDRHTEILLEINEGGEHYPDETPNLEFTAATLSGDKLYLCTDTEVFIYSYPEIKLIKTASYPVFQNIHHIAPLGDVVAVTSTGLDSVVLLDKEDLSFKEIISVLDPNEYENAPWHKFSKTVDYRKVHSTKPHQAHPNHTFMLDDEIWVTRFNHRDAVCLRDVSQKIDLAIYGVHDGHVIGDYIYFTSVHGNIIIVDKYTRKVEEVIDLNVIEDVGMPLGWCRGFAMVNENTAMIGYSKLRDTKIKENIAWVKEFVRGTTRLLHTRVVTYDLDKKEKIAEYLMPKGSIDAIYSIIIDQ